jgi:hypothetical protein
MDILPPKIPSGVLLIRTYETKQIRASMGPQESLDIHVRISKWTFFFLIPLFGYIRLLFPPPKLKLKGERIDTE